MTEATHRITALDRGLLLITGALAAYQIAVGIEGLDVLTTLLYTLAFGVLLVAGLLLIIFGFDILENPLVVVVATAIPLALSSGLVTQYLPGWQAAYLTFAALGLLAILLTRIALPPGPPATIVLAVVHAIAGLTIFLLPIARSLSGTSPAGFALVGVGGALIGLGGMLLAFLRAGRPILSKNTIYTVLPGLLLLMTAAFVAGLALAGG